MTLTSLLLVGGSSRRMGRDKATVRVEGEPLWARQIRILREFGSEVIWLSARTAPEWRPKGVELVLDPSPSRGPLSGISAALEQLPTTHLLALAVDLPRMNAAHLRLLWSLARPGCGAIPQLAARFEPLCAIYPREAARLASAVLEGTDVSLQHFARELLAQSLLRTHLVAASESPLYLNANTPADLDSV